eukprot:sb/3468211/
MRGNEEFIANVFEIVSEHQDLLIMFSLEDDHYDGLDAALLEALVKAQQSKEQGPMVSPSNDWQKANLSGVQVALGWNRPDFAERLLKADTSVKDQLALGTILIHALAWNLFEFTELLMSHDASVPMVAANAVALYNLSNRSEHLKRFLRYNLGVEVTEFSKETIDMMINKLVGHKHNFNSNVSNEGDAYFEVMVWAALSLYPDVAYKMWQGTQEPIKSALFVLNMLDTLAYAKGANSLTTVLALERNENGLGQCSDSLDRRNKRSLCW